MSLRTSANRYAKALFEVALQEKADLQKIAHDLAEVTDVLGNPGHASSDRMPRAWR